ncbi:MAG: type II toxin-antitoxin system VapC family toxin [Hymenobacter sp.]|nr:type II toxin-antitoxin system VapC family toxin [Hymenobacter sp.]
MRLLLDTHTVLWYSRNSPELLPRVAELIQSPGSICFVSRATLWEVSIKVSINKLILPVHFAQWVRQVREAGLHPLEITDDHLTTLLALPHHHRDPFDRLLIAQAITEDLTLLSRDEHFAAYPVQVR